jgi:hypothetical protein
MKKKNNKNLKILAWYVLIVSLITSLFSLYSFIYYNFLPINFFVAVIGVIGGILLLKGMKLGWYLSTFWAVIQTFGFKFKEAFIELSQFLHFEFVLDLRPEFNYIFSINIIGIIIAILLIKSGREVFKKK